MEMEDQYNMADLRQLMNGGAATSTRPHFTPIPQHPTELFPAHRATLSPPPHHHPHNHHHHHNPYELMMMAGRHHQVPNIMPRGLHDFRSDPPGGANNSTNNSASLTVTVAAANSAPSLSGGLEAETGGCLGGGDGGSGRWPRQETLTLLEIRSRLDYKFKEANQKGPLWDEVSRIMGEEHGYQRSGKKCREKFENLYKYYKKTKEGKAGRQDGKHYRFFRQLEALYGGESTTNAVIISSSLPETHFVGTNNNNNNYHQTANNIQASHETTSYHEKHSESLSLSNYNSSEFGSSSSEDNNVSEESPEKTGRKRRGGRGWKSKIKEFIDAQMRKLMERQEEWLGKVMSALEHKERERITREDEWRKQEAERIEREHKFWAKERDWIEARDAALMDALHKFTGGSSSTDVHDHHHHQVIHAPTNEDGSEILNINTAKGELLSINYHQMRKYNSKEEDHDLFSKKRKENCTSTTPTTTTSSCFFQNNEACSSLYSQGGGYNCGAEMSNEQAAGNDGGASDHSPCDNANVGAGNIAVVDDHHNSCFPFLMTEGDQNLWENYGLKITKGSQNH